MLAHDPGATFVVSPRSPWSRLNQNLDASGRKNRQQTEAEQSAELAHARLAFPAATATGCGDGKPDFILELDESDLA
jgi:hypothetical protein